MISKQFQTVLSSVHLRHTSERQLVLHALWHARKPLTLDDLSRLLAKHKLSSATVSRTMKVFLARGLAKEMEPHKPARCSNCGNPYIVMDKFGWHCNQCRTIKHFERTFVSVKAPYARAEAA